MKNTIEGDDDDVFIILPERNFFLSFRVGNFKAEEFCSSLRKGCVASVVTLYGCGLL